MKISLEWLRQYADLDAPVASLGQALIDTGTEVDRVHQGPEGVVVARVLSLQPVPESTKGVQLAEIDAGRDTPVQLLTGAPNLAVGNLVPWAPPGTWLPGWPEPLGVRAMFGGKYHSPGMLCSASELGVGDDAEGILILDEGIAGQPLREALDLDTVFEVDITPNRPDTMCHLGLARELTAALGERLRTPDDGIPDVVMSAVSSQGKVELDVRADGCARFTLRVIENVVVGPSPEWLQRRLRAIGLRPINNVVDITNYIAHEQGQPLHAFDLDRFVGSDGGAAIDGAVTAEVVVREARDGEKLLCLDGAERELGGGDLVVCSGDRPVSLAGIIGGAETAVDQSTRNILLESAAWDGVAIRATSRRLSLRTDASALFEKGLSDTIVLPALDRAAAMIADLGQGHVLRDVVDDWHAPRPAIAAIDVDIEHVTDLLGYAVDPSEAATVLAQLAFTVTQNGTRLEVTPPHFRRDVLIAEDVVEEVGRLLGYDRVPSTLPGRRAPIVSLAPDAPVEDRIRDILLGAGFDEAITWSFVAPDSIRAVHGLGGERVPIPLQNPLSEDWSVLRTSLLPGICGALATNINHGTDDVALFEMGRVFWEG